MKKTFAVFILSIVLVALSGCSSTPIASAQKAGIKTVQVERRIDSEEGMRYGMYSGGGLASILIDSLSQKGLARISVVMQTNDIVVGGLVHTQVVARIQQQYPELQLTDGESDGVFVLKILQYGFETTDIKLRRKRPFIVLAAELLNRQGKCLWSQQIINMESSPPGLGATWEEYEAHPEKLRADWNKQIENVVAQLFPAKK